MIELPTIPGFIKTDNPVDVEFTDGTYRFCFLLTDRQIHTFRYHLNGHPTYEERIEHLKAYATVPDEERWLLVTDNVGGFTEILVKNWMITHQSTMIKDGFPIDEKWWPSELAGELEQWVKQ